MQTTHPRYHAFVIQFLRGAGKALAFTIGAALALALLAVLALHA